MLFKYNKRGGEKILSVWWFVVLAIVGASIVVGVLMVYSADIDTRELESAILAERVSNCIVSDGVLNPGLIVGKFDFFVECGLDKDYFEQSGKLYFNVVIKNLSGNILFGPFGGGAAALEKDCKATKNILAGKYPKCVSKTQGVVYNDANGRVVAIVEVFAASNQRGEEVFVANV
jgi:hypothetical protein